MEVDPEGRISQAERGYEALTAFGIIVFNLSNKSLVFGIQHSLVLVKTCRGT